MKDKFIKNNIKYFIILTTIILTLIIIAILQVSIPFTSVIAKHPDAIAAEKNGDLFIWEDSDIIADYYSGANQNRYYRFPSHDININDGNYTVIVNDNYQSILRSENLLYITVEQDITTPKITLCTQRYIYHSYDITPLLGGIAIQVEGSTINVNYLRDTGKLSQYYVSDIIFNYFHSSANTPVSSADRQLLIIEIPIGANIDISISVR